MPKCYLIRLLRPYTIEIKSKSELTDKRLVCSFHSLNASAVRVRVSVRLRVCLCLYKYIFHVSMYVYVFVLKLVLVCIEKGQQWLNHKFFFFLLSVLSCVCSLYTVLPLVHMESEKTVGRKSVYTARHNKKQH